MYLRFESVPKWNTFVNIFGIINKFLPQHSSNDLSLMVPLRILKIRNDIGHKCTPIVRNENSSMINEMDTIGTNLEGVTISKYRVPIVAHFTIIS